MKRVTSFCPHSKSLPEDKVKSFRLNPMVEKISKKPGIDCRVDISGTLMKIYNKLHQAKEGK